MNLNREQLAWATGFLDGEGCFTGATKKGTFYPLLTVSQVAREPLERLQRLFDMGSIIPRPSYRLTWKPQFLYQVNGFENVQAIVAFLWLWLGQVKRTQAASVLLEHQRTVHNKRSATHGV